VSNPNASKPALIQEMKSQRAHRLSIQSIWSQFLRVCRFVSDDNIVNERLTDFSKKKKKTDKGYHPRLLRKAKRKALGMNHEELLSTTDKPKQDRIPF
ncbi:Hypothetical predicted protein, partial [Pelobates cultripes]